MTSYRLFLQSSAGGEEEEAVRRWIAFEWKSPRNREGEPHCWDAPPRRLLSPHDGHVSEQLVMCCAVLASRVLFTTTTSGAEAYIACGFVGIIRIISFWCITIIIIMRQGEQGNSD